jgi:hypothetical protein
LYREIIAVCAEIHTRHVNTLCGQKVEFLNINSGGICINHWALMGQYSRLVSISFDRFTLENGTDMLSRNVGNSQSALPNIPKE